MCADHVSELAATIIVAMRRAVNDAHSAEALCASPARTHPSSPSCDAAARLLSDAHHGPNVKTKTPTADRGEASGSSGRPRHSAMPAAGWRAARACAHVTGRRPLTLGMFSTRSKMLLSPSDKDLLVDRGDQRAIESEEKRRSVVQPTAPVRPMSLTRHENTLDPCITAGSTMPA